MERCVSVYYIYVVYNFFPSVFAVIQIFIVVVLLEYGFHTMSLFRCRYSWLTNKGYTMLLVTPLGAGLYHAITVILDASSTGPFIWINPSFDANPFSRWTDSLKRDYFYFYSTLSWVDQKEKNIKLLPTNAKIKLMISKFSNILSGQPPFYMLFPIF